RTHKELARPSGFDALVNDNLLVGLRQAVPHHPTRGTTGSGSSGWIFAAIEKHPGAHFAPVFAFSRDKITKLCAGSFQQRADSAKIRLQVRQTLRVANRHNRKRQSGRHDLAWPFGSNVVGTTPESAADLISRQSGTKLRIMLTHLAKDITGDAIDHARPART